MGFSRRLPNSNIGRNSALRKALEKQLSIPAPDRFLTNQTNTRLVAIQPLYKTKFDAIDVALANWSLAASEKQHAAINLEIYVKAYLDQVINGVKMKKIPKEKKPLWGLEVGNDNYPAMDNETELRNAADKVISGDAAWISGGGAALTWPTIAEVTTLRDDFVAADTATSTQKDAYDTALEAVDTLNTEANGVIKKVWDEVETRYNEEEPASKRDNAREWGVIYINTEGKTVVIAAVVDKTTGLPEAGVLCELEVTGESVETGPDGLLNHEFEASGQNHFRFSKMGKVTQIRDADLQPNETINYGTVEMEPV